MIPESYSFPRFLAAKQSIDDRSLNRPVWARLQERVAQHPPGTRLRVLEVGAGIGTMIERALEWDLLACADYTALDQQAENIAIARQRLPQWAAAHGWQAEALEDGRLALSREAHPGPPPAAADSHLPAASPPAAPSSQVIVDFQAADVFAFQEQALGQPPPGAPTGLAQPHGGYDLLIAHAFLDLLDLPAALPRLLALLKPGGCFYFTLNFDGMTTFEPQIDPALDALIEKLYHQTMDERRTAGHPSGDSRSGRHLFTLLPQNGAEILAAGASDWVVFAGDKGIYPVDEAYFLHHILHFVETSLAGRPELDAAQLAAWIARRRAQVETGELVYIAHQVDFVGVRRG